MPFGSTLGAVLLVSVLLTARRTDGLLCYSCKPCPSFGQVVNCSAGTPNCLIAKGRIGLYDLTLRMCAGPEILKYPLTEMTCKTYPNYTFDGMTFDRVTACLCGDDYSNAQFSASPTLKPTLTRVTLLAAVTLLMYRFA